MSDLVVAFGLVLVIEGLLWALAPQTGRRLLEMLNEMAPSDVQRIGFAAVIAGVVLVWLARG